MAQPRHPSFHHSAHGHRVDEIHVHERKSKKVWPWILLLAGVFLILWGLFGRQRTASQMVTLCEPATLSFAPGSAQFAAEDRGALQTLASCLKANPESKVRLEGHASAAEGPGLAQRRAEAIGRELRARGVASAQFSVGVATEACGEESAACGEKSRSVEAVPQRRK